MAATIFTAISALRMILETETDAESPDNETTYAGMRVAIETLFMLLFSTGFSGTVTGISTTTITHAGAAQTPDVHNGRTTLITSGSARGNLYTIDDCAAQTLIHTGDNPETDGVLVGDTFLVLYDIKTNLDGHDHDTINAKGIVLGNDTVDSEHYVADSIDSEHYAPTSVDTAAIKSGVGNSGSSLTDGTSVACNMQDYCFFPSIYVANVALLLTGGVTSGATYTGRFGLYNSGGDTYAWTAYWRYITATDEPFMYAIRDKVTGEFIAHWICTDPPPGYWGMDEKPVDFVPPLIFSKQLENIEEITIFKYEKDGYDELANKSKTDKKPLFEMLNDYDYNDKSKLFISKNLVHI